MSTAESLTGGQLAARLTAVPGASATYVGGVVAYATEVKVSVLGVRPTLVERHGVVSAECALAMARGVRDLTGSTYGVSTTGVAGPTEQEGKPVGTVYVGLCGPSAVTSLALELVGDRSGVVEQTLEAALGALVELLTTDSSGTGRSTRLPG
ncbi:CinA family protein [soil metagenome]